MLKLLCLSLYVFICLAQRAFMTWKIAHKLGRSGYGCLFPGSHLQVLQAEKDYDRIEARCCRQSVFVDWYAGTTE